MGVGVVEDEEVNGDVWKEKRPRAEHPGRSDADEVIPVHQIKSGAFSRLPPALNSHVGFLIFLIRR